MNFFTHPPIQHILLKRKVKGCVSLSVKSYYVWGHTAHGLKSFSKSNLADIENIYVLNHPSETIKTAVIEGLVNKFKDTCEMELIKSINGDEFLDGVVIRDKSLAVVSQSAKFDHVSVVELKKNESIEVDELLGKKNRYLDAAYTSFETGLKIHDDLEEIYINEMDFTKADQLAADFVYKLVSPPSDSEEEGAIYHRFFGTNTKDGVVNVVPELIESVSKAYFIKGRAGTGKSTFMKKIAHECKENGYDVELYHCSFDSNSIDMVFVSELDFCIFDSTDPHEFFPERDVDEIIDLYEELVTPGTDEKYAEEIDELNHTYKSHMKEGIEHLKEAGLYQSQLENEFANIDETDINRVTDYILSHLN